MERTALPFEWNDDTLTEHEETYVLSSFSTLKEAITNVLAFVGMAPVNKTDVQDKTHSLHMTGVFLGKWKVLGKAIMVQGVDEVKMSLAIKCEDPNIARYIATVIV